MNLLSEAERALEDGDYRKAEELAEEGIIDELAESALRIRYFRESNRRRR